MKKPQVNATSPIAILGAGSWGTALALYLSRRGQEVRLWSIDISEITAMLTDNESKRYLPGHILPKSLYPVADLKQTLDGIKDVLIVVPSVGFRDTLRLAKPLLSTDARIICASKGLDAKTGNLLGKIAEEILGKKRLFAVLSGPSFAREVAAGLPCSVMVASKNANFTKDIMQRFNSDIFRTYPATDVIGVEVGGIVKNVIAIATGIFDGMDLGANARSALITHGLKEMTALGVALGGKKETFVGLSGLGDLILTCSDNQSRNRRMGLALGSGKTIAEAEREIGQVVEGKQNAELAVKLAKKHKVDLPICKMVWAILQGKIDAKTAVQNYLSNC